MGVAVDQFRVNMSVRVRFAGGVSRQVFMLVMNVVNVSMFMLGNVVLMFVFVMLGDMDVNADSHQCGSQHERHAKRIAQ